MESHQGSRGLSTFPSVASPAAGAAFSRDVVENGLSHLDLKCECGWCMLALLQEYLIRWLDSHKRCPVEAREASYTLARAITGPQNTVNTCFDL